jgi:hypothetical protein
MWLPLRLILSLSPEDRSCQAAKYTASAKKGRIANFLSSIAEWQRRIRGRVGFQSALANRKLKVPAPHSNSAMMKNSCDEVSYSTRSTLALQQT